MNWNYSQPVKIKFGNGSTEKLSEIINICGGKKGLLVSDSFFAANGLADEIVKKSEGKLTHIFSDLSPNPDIKEVDACADVIRAQSLDFIVALGGGSALDLAKAAATICLTDESIEAYHGTGVAITTDHLPFIAIPTTSGTGSEVTCVSVLTDHEKCKKAPIVSEGFYPDYAIIDPLLTISQPPHLTANTGMDVLSHALEGYWSKQHQPICDAMALHAIRLVLKYLPLAYDESENTLAREKMSEASLMAGLAFTLPKTTASHACSYPLTNIYGIPHGEACSLTLDYFARINGSEELDGRISELAQNLGLNSTEELADKIRDLKERVGVRTNLKDFNLSDEDIEELVTISRHPNLYNNPVEVTDEMLREMYTLMR